MRRLCLALCSLSLGLGACAVRSLCQSVPTEASLRQAALGARTVRYFPNVRS